jgi:DNA-directed RNA polymerase subunit H (RpoH/RPB5)
MERERKQFITYSNLAEFLKYRRIVSDYVFLDQKEFTKEINISKYIIINGTTINERSKYMKNNKGVEEHILIVFVGAGSLHAAKLNEFNKLFKVVQKQIDEERYYNIIFITADDVTSNIKKSVLEEKNKMIHFEFYNYNKFVIVVPQHVLVPKHEIVSEKESQEYMNEFYIKKDMLPRILSIDPAVVWIGGRGGDIIKITRVSENAGIAINYRLVVEINTVN